MGLHLLHQTVNLAEAYDVLAHLLSLSGLLKQDRHQ